MAQLSPKKFQWYNRIVSSLVQPKTRGSLKAESLDYIQQGLLEIKQFALWCNGSTFSSDENSFCSNQKRVIQIVLVGVQSVIGLCMKNCEFFGIGSNPIGHPCLSQYFTGLDGGMPWNFHKVLQWDVTSQIQINGRQVRPGRPS